MTRKTVVHIHTQNYFFFFKFMTGTKSKWLSLWEESNLCTSLFSRVVLINIYILGSGIDIDIDTHTYMQGGRRTGCKLEVAPFEFPSSKPLKDLLQP